MRMTRQGVRDLGNVRPHHGRRAMVTGIHDGRPRVAVDVAVSNRQIVELEAAGFYVAVVAENGESDAAWLSRSAAAMVDIICSPDKKVGLWAHDTGRLFVRMHGNKRTPLLRLVRQAWRRWYVAGCP